MFNCISLSQDDLEDEVTWADEKNVCSVTLNDRLKLNEEASVMDIVDGTASVVDSVLDLKLSGLRPRYVAIT